jgi:putative PIN family toxin of toxin-antitoxin system
MRLVLDTSVLIAALRSPSGASAAVLRLILREKLSLLMSLAIAYEYRDVAFRPEQLFYSSLSMQEVQAVLEELESISEAIEISIRYRPLSSDPNDDLVLELAINGKADTIVTNNIRHLRQPAAAFGIDVVDPKTLLRSLAGG